MSDVVVEIIKAVVLLVTGGGAIGGIIAFRKDRREEPKDKVATLESILAQVVTATNTSIEALNRSTESETKAATAQSRAIQAEARAQAAEARASRAEQVVQVFRNIIVRHVIQIIAWIDDGAAPPPPKIEQELRDFVNDINDT